MASRMSDITESTSVTSRLLWRTIEMPWLPKKLLSLPIAMLIDPDPDANGPPLAPR